jgi:hypothetical protein
MHDMGNPFYGIGKPASDKSPVANFLTPSYGPSLAQYPYYPLDVYHCRR